MNSHQASIRAIVIPSCGGKTSAAERYDVIDLDVGARQGPIGSLVRELNDLASKQLISWDASNEVQWSFMRHVLADVEVGRACILLHSVKAAKALGIRDIHVWLPAEQLHLSNISRRGQHMANIAIANAHNIRSEASQFGLDIWEFSTHREFELRLEQVVDKTSATNSTTSQQQIRIIADGIEHAWYRKVEDHERP